jgi:shikimate kinase
LNKKELPQIERVVLIGYRCAGKTTVGKNLSRELQWKYISTDELIVAKSGKPITLFVNKFGWEKFRHLEHEVINQLAGESNCIIDCGGGVVEDSESMEVLNRSALVVWIDANPDDFKWRLSKGKDRPLLSEANLESDFTRHYQKRLPLYKKYSQLYFNTSEKNVIEICRDILSGLS